MTKVAEAPHEVASEAPLDALDQAAAEALHTRRLALWGQTPQTWTPDPEAATALIARVGLATLYPTTPELPNLLHAYTGDPTTQATSDWDSASGHVYTWRWELGRREAAFYTTLVRKRPTLVNWPLLPAVLRLFGELRATDEVYDTGGISKEAYRVAQALSNAPNATLSTGELREAAGFPAGQRGAYLKAVEELDTRLLLAKVFALDDEEMRHTLVADRYPQHVRAADRLTRAEALDALLATYLPSAVYAQPAPLARHLHLLESDLRDALERLADQGHAQRVMLPGQKGACYVWQA
ncbi:MAG TPA: hypothetical protein VMV29_11215 [Ktedonobacterales bacterium]|nr:hypothetical protein [Ktedonobacterales bacterium]